MTAKERGKVGRYRSVYFRDPRDLDRISERAKTAGMSFNDYVVRTSRGDATPGSHDAESLRVATEDARYWRERFEQMAGLAQNTQAEVLQLRAELRTRALEPAASGASGSVAESALAPRLLVVFTSLRSADGKYRVWTEAELADELGLDDSGREVLRGSLSTLFRANLLEPQRSGWRYRA